MSIYETMYYNTIEQNLRMPEWARSERYEYCEGFYENSASAGSRKRAMSPVAVLLSSVF